MKEPVKKLFHKIAGRFGLEIKRNRQRVVSIRPRTGLRGSVLLAYFIEPFLLKPGEPVPNTHTHYWESLQMARTFLRLGYALDIINYTNYKFTPKKDYSFFISARTHFQRIAELLNKDCVKIVHLETSHWLFNNSAAYRRCLALQQRRGVTLKSIKWVEPNWAIECADYATIKGNGFTVSTYAYAQKPFLRTSNPAYTAYDWPKEKNFEICRKNFLWFGSEGLVHKGLDLVLEAFVEMPDYCLTVCGPIQKEVDFERAFYKELYQTPNIHTVGWVDICSPEFVEITNNCIGLIYPSCAEGQSGAVVTCLQAGLIPILSYQSGVDVDDFGLILKECTIDEIKNSIEYLSSLSIHELGIMARRAWEYARANHTRKKFARQYRAIVEDIISERLRKR